MLICISIANSICFSGKTLTFDEALANAESGDNDPEGEVKSKYPDQCCPAICGKMWVVFLTGFWRKSANVAEADYK